MNTLAARSNSQLLLFLKGGFIAALTFVALGTGGVLGFLGFACPVCNKILMYVFGAELLLSYLEPARIYLAVLGTLVISLALYIKLKRRRSLSQNSLDVASP